jgi:hypothetical protein
MANPNLNPQGSPDSSSNTGRPEAERQRANDIEPVRPDADPTQDIPSGSRVREDDAETPRDNGRPEAGSRSADV